MAIAPINGVNFSNQISKPLNTNEIGSSEFVSFKDIFKNAVNNVETTQQVAEQDMLKIATGQSDDLHTLMINSAKADLALQTLVQVRNKAIDAYNEIMRINL